MALTQKSTLKCSIFDLFCLLVYLVLWAMLYKYDASAQYADSPCLASGVTATSKVGINKEGEILEEFLSRLDLID